jgi:nucleoside-diphosphate-sugar epimerase
MAFDRNYKDSRILVTGGAGFIGSHLSERLLDNSEFTILEPAELAEKVISYIGARSSFSNRCRRTIRGNGSPISPRRRRC